MNPADKLQEISDKISQLANATADKIQELAAKVNELADAIDMIQEELAKAIASIREQLQNPPGPPSSRPKLPTP